MTLIPLIEQSIHRTIFQAENRNHRFVNPMFLPIELKPQNNDMVITF